ncbi:phage tail tape measure protein [Microbacterium sp. P26]|uniref:phage tail tape measure protein n=1 Tax=Microbacterium TaxID=33882 RepID=UPI002040F3CC|nr:phage tail tape measure protein [Microbacterium sp. P26]MCM3500617.1 phage tail tape measure protein [Microbacterium sp. P26]
MADRSVRVSLILQASGYMSGMDAVAQKTAKTGSEVEKLAQKKDAFNALGTAALGLGTAIGVGIGVAVAKFSEFDQQMSSVQAATHESAENMGILRDAALEAGESTVYSATESAAAIEELAKAGVSTADILSGALGGSLDLAAAGELGVARAAEITSTALNQFGLDGGQAAHVADVLAAGAGKAMGSVDDLANGLKFVGPVAAAMGVSLEETTGVLALFAQQGIIGEQAGTSLRGVLSSLTSPSKEARKEIEALGLTLYDSEGNFLGLENAAGQLSKAYTDMDGASRDASLGIIFGRETVTAATALYKAGAEGVDEWTQAVDDSGYAAETARARLDNLAGDVEALGGAFDTALIQTGSGANDVLREMVQGLSALVDMYNDLPEPVQTATLLIGAGAGAVALASGAALVAIPRFAEFKANVSAAGLSMGRMALQGAGVAAALSVVTAAVGVLITKQAEMRSGAEEFASSFDEATGALTGYTRELIAKKLADQGAFDGAREAGVSQRELTDALYQGGKAYENVMERLHDAHEASGGWNATIGNSINATKDMNVQLTDAQQRYRDMKAAQEGSTGALSESERSAQRNKDALAELAGQATSTKVDVNTLADAIRGFGSAQMDTNAAARGFEQALDDLQGSLEQNGSTLDRGVQAGRDNEANLDDLARATLEWSAATVQQTGDQEAANQIVADGRQRLIEMLGQFNITGAEAEAYADKLGLIPENIPTAVTLNTSVAQQQLNDFIAGIQNRQAALNVRVNTMISQGASDQELAGAVGIGLGNYTGNLYDKGKAQQFEAGGIASGIYAGRAGGIHKFAEESLPWEAYISPHPAHRQKNLAILDEVGRRLGAWQQPTMSAAPMYAAAPAAAAPVTYTPVINQRPGVSDHRIAQVAQEQFSFGLGR